MNSARDKLRFYVNEPGNILLKNRIRVIIIIASIRKQPIPQAGGVMIKVPRKAASSTIVILRMTLVSNKAPGSLSVPEMSRRRVDAFLFLPAFSLSISSWLTDEYADSKADSIVEASSNMIKTTIPVIILPSGKYAEVPVRRKEYDNTYPGAN